MPNKPDEKGAPVEKYKLTEEQKKFQKEFDGILRLRQLVKSGTLDIQLRTQSLNQLVKLLEIGMSNLKIPSEAVKELPGMNFKPGNQIPPGVSPESLQMRY